MIELRNKDGRVVTELIPEEAPYSFTQRVYKTWGMEDREYYITFCFRKNPKTGEPDPDKISGIQMNAR